MYAILVRDHGGPVESYILSTMASSCESAMQLMSARAEEVIEESLESEDDQAQFYVIERFPEQLRVRIVNSEDGPDAGAVVDFEATAIDRVI